MATWSYEEDFESFSVAALSGQGGWSAPAFTDFQVVTDYAASGTKALRCGGAGVNYGGNTKSITSVDTSGSIGYVSIRTDNNTSVDNGGFYLKSGSSYIIFLVIGAAGADDLSLRDPVGGTFQVLDTAVSIDTWYRVGIEMDFAGDRVRANINDSPTFSAWLSVPAYSNINTIEVSGGNGDGANKLIWLDYFSASYAAAGPTVVPTLMMMGVGA